MRLECPDWCVETRHGSGEVRVAESEAAGGVRYVVGHQGPTFGAFAVGSDVDLVTGETVKVDVLMDTVVLDQMGVDGATDPRILRQVAADALAAAEWLERTVVRTIETRT